MTVCLPLVTVKTGVMFHKDGELACGATQMNCTNVSHGGSTRGEAK